MDEARSYANLIEGAFASDGGEKKNYSTFPPPKFIDITGQLHKAPRKDSPPKQAAKRTESESRGPGKRRRTSVGRSDLH